MILWCVCFSDHALPQTPDAVEAKVRHPQNLILNKITPFIHNEHDIAQLELCIEVVLDD